MIFKLIFLKLVINICFFILVLFALNFYLIYLILNKNTDGITDGLSPLKSLKKLENITGLYH
jgi:hypothetical protein